MKSKFLGLELVPSAGLNNVLRNWMAIILFSGIGYFISAIFLGMIQGDPWKYIQSEIHYYFTQGVLLIVGALFGHISRVLINKYLGDHFFLNKKLDIPFYLISYLIAYLVINEMFGL